MDNVEIYYFSGTGNSLHVARELKKRIPGTKLIPIVRLLTEEAIELKGEIVGFVFPIYFLTMPIPVKKFIKKIDLKSAKYLFAIATRMGTPHSAFTDIKKILKKKGKNLDSYLTLNMASNDPKYDYKAPTKKEIETLESTVHNRLNSFQKNILCKVKNHEKDTSITEPVPSSLVKLIPTINIFIRPFAEFIGFKCNYYVDSKCIGCGICEDICLSEKIKLINGKPVWQRGIKCFYCYACINFCPNESIQIKSYTENNDRYPHPYANVGDIAKQKHC